MIIKNRLKEILQVMGIRSMVPTTQVFEEQLGGMTLHRFNKLLNNEGKEIQLQEVQVLTAWLSRLTGKPKAELHLLTEEKLNA